MAVSDPLRFALAGKIAYGALFVGLLPVLLVAWARGTADIVTIALPAWPRLGLAIAAVGFSLIVGGWIALKVHGEGLPMNAFPPPKLVTKGVFRLAPHPIYLGFVIVCAGISLSYGSASGLYLVTPAMVMASAALVLGYEGPDLARRLGPRPPTWLALAPDDQGKPTPAQRLGAYAGVILPWCVLYQMITWIGPPRDAFSAALPFEARLPVVEPAETIYASTYFAVLLAPLVAPTRRDLRAFEVRALLTSALAFPLYLALPLIAEPRAFIPQGILGRLLLAERSLDSPAGAFPSSHVIWALLSADVLGSATPRLRLAWRGWAILVALSCILTGMHAILDVIASFAVVALVDHRASIWEGLRRGASLVAGSWREWRLGPMRIINHGVYAGLGAFLGLAIASSLLGPGHEGVLLLTAAGGLVGAGLWARIIEGSPQLMRPFGFWGGLLGIVATALAAPLLGSDPWTVLASCCVAAPWVQSAGRLRCLVQGCCHGSPAHPSIGIRYHHPRSRVVRLSPLEGVPIHPTPLYSILWNVVIALAMIRLSWLRVDVRFIAGAYLLLMGLGRFVEESLRGEPQTPIHARLRLYQWASIGALIAGATLTALHGSTPLPSPSPSLSGLLAAAAFGLITTFAMGVDFPDSKRPFSRLA